MTKSLYLSLLAIACAFLAGMLFSIALARTASVTKDSNYECKPYHSESGIQADGFVCGWSDS